VRPLLLIRPFQQVEGGRERLFFPPRADDNSSLNCERVHCLAKEKRPPSLGSNEGTIISDIMKIWRARKGRGERGRKKGQQRDFAIVSRRMQAATSSAGGPSLESEEEESATIKSRDSDRSWPWGRRGSCKGGKHSLIESFHSLSPSLVGE